MAKKKTAKKGTKKKTTKSAAPKEMLVVGTKVKAYVKSQEKMCSGELLDALNEKVHKLLDEAVARTTANNRSTVRSQDL